MLQRKVRHATKMLLVVALLILTGTNAIAQSSATVNKIAKAMTDSLAYLQFTSEQKPAAEKLNNTAASELMQVAKKARADTGFRGKALAGQVIGIMKQRNAGLQKIFNPEQQKLFQERKVAQMADVQTKIMIAQLDLSDTQIQQVYDVNLKYMAKILEDKRKLDAATSKLGKLKESQSLKGDMKDRDKELKKILSPDQYALHQKHQQEIEAAIKEKMQQKKG
ncbi:hypothetical protein ACPPVU_15860 [Mucilaginibacter sp. McL0603]|uniref:hypothetical protein n=1 Tax=Mucilaginibacter sp. McL0603 TaxID=3415670 RepID=UPI003CF15292